MSKPKGQGYDQRLWGGRFASGPSEDTLAFTTSIGIDWRLWRADIEASIAHAQMLGEQNIISKPESSTLIQGLREVAKDFEEQMSKGQWPFPPHAEDVHSVIELRLRDKVGAVAGKLHTARSRNDQVVTAFRLTLLGECKALREEVRDLQRVLLQRAEAELETWLPGLTHIQHAQPVSLAHHLLAYFWMLDRDHSRFTDWDQSTRVNPLGSAALAGTSFPIDRQSTSRALGFHRPSENSLDAVADRDFAIEFVSNLSLVALHLSRLAEELTYWSAPEFGFVELHDEVTTGSSIMPQKKNPDVAELIRGRTGRALGAWIQLATMMKALPLAYNRDQQEDKEPVFYALDSVRASLRLSSRMVQDADFKRDRMAKALLGDFSNATDLADSLAKQGLPFREAHEVAGHVVRWCLENKRALETLTLGELQGLDPRFDEATRQALQHDQVARARTSEGGTAPQAVRVQIEKAQAALKTNSP
ncbi:MAG TPA: argininosuccinate lyase [Pseudobdellovibrionaceae bacterium]|nr:argininosuccinate lyase [Pseudobdellovibrionaceae bacterium]